MESYSVIWIMIGLGDVFPIVVSILKDLMNLRNRASVGAGIIGV